MICRFFPASGGALGMTLESTDASVPPANATSFIVNAFIFPDSPTPLHRVSGSCQGVLCQTLFQDRQICPGGHLAEEMPGWVFLMFQAILKDENSFVFFFFFWWGAGDAVDSPNDAQGFLLARHSGIFPDNAWGTL